ncbi:OmpA family protein [Massilia glaciei]|uniref:Flagellar motor protein MotB n=1 Tax=Massilia glaciei TaxID=1524097 RepID=A0A2U2HEH0_9BURK|nr:OmpA family protein [Massilia glaciei]PWF41914.1 flagellar motor protein MotB [Massilia glaciei]
MKNTKKIAMAVAILCSAGPILAQDINPSWYVQPSISGMHPDDDWGPDENGAGVGLRFGRALTPRVDIQVGASHARVTDGPQRYRQTLLGVDGLFLFSRNRFRPFILLGIGAERDNVRNGPVTVSEVSPYVAAGVGFQLDLNKSWALQADIRNVHGRIDNVSTFGFDRPNNQYLTIGFNYTFNQPAPPPPPPPEPADTVIVPVPPPPPPPPPQPGFEKVTLSATELFAFNSANLTSPQPRLDEIAAALQADPSISDVTITGYADRLGAEQYNQQLSEKRAMAVRDYLVNKGVDGSRLQAVGRGESNPVVVCNQRSRAELIKCLEPNRRVEVEQITIERRVQ